MDVEFLFIGKSRGCLVPLPVSSLQRPPTSSSQGPYGGREGRICLKSVSGECTPFPLPLLAGEKAVRRGYPDIPIALIVALYIRGSTLLRYLYVYWSYPLPYEYSYYPTRGYWSISTVPPNTLIPASTFSCHASERLSERSLCSIFIIFCLIFK